jgi:hypothetical protein
MCGVIYREIGEMVMLIHEEKAAYDSWIKLVFLIPLGLLITSAVLAGNNEPVGALVLFIETAFIVLLFYFIFPRKYRIYEERLQIVLGAPFTINIPLATIEKVRNASAIKAFVYTGVRFATSARNAVEIVRRHGINYVISPRNCDLFIDILSQTIGSGRKL